MANRDRGKRTERALARRLGGRRVGVLGKSDMILETSHTVFEFEIKERKRCVVQNWLAQAERNCSQGKTPALIIHLHYQPHSEDMVVMRLRDFEDWLGKVNLP
ncbi:MAG: hypothetical protein ACUVWN_04600 [bacterium]